MTHQTSFTHAEFAAKKKTTRREKFLSRMEEVIPWAASCSPSSNPIIPRANAVVRPSAWNGCSASISSSNGMAWPTKPSKTRSMTVRRYNNLPALI